MFSVKFVWPVINYSIYIYILKSKPESLLAKVGLSQDDNAPVAIRAYIGI